jgi:DNA polymerase I-like protein with 3'-5' exonuclease and polymerase domains
MGLIDEILKGNYISVDCETTGLDWKKDRIVKLAVADKDREYIYDNIQQALFWLERVDVVKVGHNFNFDLLFIEKELGKEIQGPVADTLLMAQLIDENQELKLKTLAEKYIGKDSTQHARALYSWLASNKLSKDRISEAPEEILNSYVTEDVRNTYSLAKRFAKRLFEMSDKVQQVFRRSHTPIRYFEQEMQPTERVLKRMEQRGIRVSTPLLTQYQDWFKKGQQEVLEKLQALCADETNKICMREFGKIWKEREIQWQQRRNKIDEKIKSADDPKKKAKYEQQLSKLVASRSTFFDQINSKYPVFNWNSTNQIGDLFFNSFNFQRCFSTAKTPTGNWSTSDFIFREAEQMESLPEKVREICRYYLDYKRFQKAISTEIIGTKKLIINGRIHASYKQTSPKDTHEASGTVSGRLSCAKPNMQNQQEYILSIFVPDE